MSLELSIGNIIKAGTPELPDKNLAPNISEKDVDKTIQIILQCARENPDWLLTEAILSPNSPMIPFVMAALFSKVDSSYFDDYNCMELINIIFGTQDAQKLLEFVEYLKSGSFGKKLGSRPQKIVKRIMESWDDTTLERHIRRQPNSFYGLLRVVHPKYTGNRGNLIRELIKRRKQQGTK